MLTTIDELCRDLDELTIHQNTDKLDKEFYEMIDFDLDQLAVHYVMTDGQYHYPPPAVNLQELILQFQYGDRGPEMFEKVKVFLLKEGRGRRMLLEKIDVLARPLPDLIPDIDCVENYIYNYLNNIPPAQRIF